MREPLIYLPPWTVAAILGLAFVVGMVAIWLDHRRHPASKEDIDP